MTLPLRALPWSDMRIRTALKGGYSVSVAIIITRRGAAGRASTQIAMAALRAEMPARASSLRGKRGGRPKGHTVTPGYGGSVTLSFSEKCRPWQQMIVTVAWGHGGHTS